MNCLRCGVQNQSLSKLCSACGAVLPVNFGDIQAQTTLDLESGRSYDAPDVSYPNPAIDGLREAIASFEEGGPVQPVAAWAKNLTLRFDELADAVPRMLDATAAHRREHPEDEVTPRIAYLVQRGSGIFEQGLVLLKQYMRGDHEDPEVILEELQTGCDYLNHSAHLVWEMLGLGLTPQSGS